MENTPVSETESHDVSQDSSSSILFSILQKGKTETTASLEPNMLEQTESSLKNDNHKTDIKQQECYKINSNSNSSSSVTSNSVAQNQDEIKNSFDLDQSSSQNDDFGYLQSMQNNFYKRVMNSDTEVSKLSPSVEELLQEKMELDSKCLEYSDISNGTSDLNKNESKKKSQNDGARCFKCVECGKGFTSDGMLNRHMRVHMKKVFDCHICGKKFPRTTLRDEHMVEHSLDIHGRYLCTICEEPDVTFDSLRELKVHRLGHMNKTPLLCNHCSYVTSRQSDLVIHMRLHEDTRPFACQQCNASFKQKGHLKRHELTHTDHRPFICSICNYSSRTAHHLHNHMLVQHTDTQPFPCDICGLGFASACSLQNHKACHSDNRPFKCSECDFRCKRKTGLQAHMQSHFPTKRYPCNLCNYFGRTSFHLKRHMNIHREEPPYKCVVCSQRFRTFPGLENHMRTHKDNSQLFCCSLCDFRSNDSSSLLSHMETHMSKPPDDDGNYTKEDASPIDEDYDEPMNRFDDASMNESTVNVKKEIEESNDDVI